MAMVIGNTLVPYTAGGNITVGGDWLPLTSPSHAAPIANFIATSPTSGTAPLTVSFTDRIDWQTPNGWAWYLR